MRLSLCVCLFVSLCFANVAFANHSTLRNDPFNTLPDSNVAAFRTQSRNFWEHEDAQREGEALSGFIVSGGIHGTSSTLTSAAFATIAHTPERVNQVSTAITYTGIASGTCWTIISSDNDGIAGWSRVGTTSYYFQCNSNAVQPSLPANSVWLMEITQNAAGTALLNVHDIHGPSPVQTRVASYLNMFNVRDYFAVGNNAKDNTTALRAAYTACAAARGTMFIPDGTYRYSAMLTWDGSCNVQGQSKEFTKLRKTADVTGIQIGSGVGAGLTGGEVFFENFTLDAVAGLPGAANGINIVLCNRCAIRNVTVTGHRGDGINHANGARLLLQQVGVTLNGGVGIRVNASPKDANTNVFDDVDVNGNTSHGIELTSSDANVILYAIIHNNGGYGLRIADGVGNYGVVYTENNTAGCVQLTSAAIRNFIITTNTDAVGCIDDDSPIGNNNMFLSLSNAFGAFLSIPNVGRHRPNTNIAGGDVSIAGAQAGAGAVGQTGGRALITGGDAAGTAGAASGGDVRLNGGAGINAGSQGIVALQGGNAAPVVVGANTPTAGSVSLEIQSTTRAFLPSRMTLAQANAMTMVDGMHIYCTDCNPGSIPCTAGGGGAHAFRQQASWRCQIT